MVVVNAADDADAIGERVEIDLSDSPVLGVSKHAGNTGANGWVLASSTSLVSGPTTWYGSDEDAGTPGYEAGGPLPVELSPVASA